MRIEIDQSGKIENTNRATVIAFSNNKNDILVILSKDKKAIQRYFRKQGKPKLFIYLTFIALIYVLIVSHLKNRDQIIIDREYPGYEKLITSTIRKMIENSNIREVTVSVHQIGKKSKAHDLAWKELQKRSHQNVRLISSNKLIRVIETKIKPGSV